MKYIFYFILYSFIYLFYFLPLIIKIYVTLKKISLKSFYHIPHNWFKLIFSTDILHPFEILPSIEKVKIAGKLKDMKIIQATYIFSLNSYEDFWKKVDTKNIFLNIKNRIENLFIILFMPINFILAFLLFLPAIIFRYSLKSTVWIYLPLIWLIEPQDKSDLTTRMKIESKNFIAYLMFFYSLIVVFVFTLIPLVFPYTDIGVYLQNFAFTWKL